MEVLARILLKIACFLEWLYFSCRWMIFGDEQHKVVLAGDDQLLNFSATTLAEKIRNKEITSEEVVRAYIKRIKDVNPTINAVVEDRFEAALNDAIYVDNFISKNAGKEKDMEARKPLLGVPVTIKECLAVKGLSYTGCSKVREGTKAEKDSDVVFFLKESGAIPLLVSSTPEYCAAYETTNNIIGTTRNPYNTLYTPGGSSGGEGALIGAGASLVGIGSDILGSIRVPCAFNGIFGHKPTSGIVSLEGHFPFSSDKNFLEYLVIGPLARYAEDLKPVLKVMAGDNAAKLNLNEKVDLKHVKVFFMEDTNSTFGLLPVAKEIKIAIKEAVMYLSRYSHCVVTDKKFPEMADAFEINGAACMDMKDQADPFTDSKVKYNVVTELFKHVFGKSIFTTNTFTSAIMNNLAKRMHRKFPKYLEAKLALKQILMDEFKDNGVFLYPSFPTSALRHGLNYTSLAGSMYPGIFNMLGFPAACVPVGLDEKGMPIGIQVVAAPYQDRLCLAIAQELEKCFLGWQPITNV